MSNEGKQPDAGEETSRKSVTKQESTRKTIPAQENARKTFIGEDGRLILGKGYSAGFFTQTKLLMVKNLQCTLRGARKRLVLECVFMFIAMGILILLAYLVPSSEFEDQKKAQYPPFDVVRGLEASATRAPRVIGYAPKKQTGEWEEVYIENMKKAYDRKGVSVPLVFKGFKTLEELEDAHNTQEDGMDLAVFFNVGADGKVEYTLLADIGNIYSPPDPNVKMTSLATCRQEYSGPINERVPEAPYSCPVNGYFYSGLLGLQYLVVQGIADHWFDATGGKKAELPQIRFENFPKKAYKAELPQYFRVLIPILVVFPVANLINGLLILIVSEKESRVKDGLKMIGVSELAYWLSWFLMYTVFMFTIAAVFTVCLFFLNVIDATNPLILFLLLFLFGESVISFAFLLTPFFHKPKTAGQVGTLILNGAAMLFLVQTYTPPNPSTEGVLKALRIITSFAFAAGLDEICDHEHDGGVSFGDLFTLRADRVGWSLAAMLFDTCLYAVLAVYLDNIIPNQYGVRSHPFWFLMPSSSAKRLSKYDDSSELDNNPNIEDVPASLKGKEAIKIRNVRKTYAGKKTETIKGISLNVYADQITCILGKNGAGKSTLFGILVGLIPPSKGKSIVFGLDTSNPRDVAKLRKVTGVCLQSDLLFGPMTVKEHLVFYGNMRGLKGAELKAEINSLLKDLKLTEKVNARADTLSGGQKRKLSVGTAMIGDPKIILLDEPSAGVDPVSRRHLWALLKKKKEGKVILLTTHFLDEADFLADRKAIINNGELKCHGSSLFLKHRFGVGYHVVLEIEEKADEKQSDAVFKKYVPSALETKRYVPGKEIIYSLPTDDSQKFPDLFRDLEGLLEKNKDFKSYGVSMTTLEEVFLLICNEELDLKQTIDIATAEENKGQASASKVKFNEEVEEEDETGARRRTHAAAVGDEFNLINEKSELEIDAINSWYVQSAMRFKRLFRSWVSLLLMTVGPTILVIIGLAIMYRQDILHIHSSLSLDKLPDEYKDAIVAVKDMKSLKGAPHAYIDSIKDTFGKVEEYNGHFDALLDFAQHDPGAMAAIDITDHTKSIDFRFNGSFLHGPPILMHSLYKHILYSTGGNSPSLNITGKFQPFSSLRKAIDTNAIVAALLVAPSFTFPVVGMVMELLKDREIDARNYMRACGVSTVLYYLPFFTVYSVVCLFVMLLQVTILLCFQFPAFASVNAMFVIIVLQLLSIPSTLLFGAFFAFFFENVETGQAVFSQLPAWLGTVVGLGLVVLDGVKGSLWSPTVNSDVLSYHSFFSFVDVFYVPFATFYWVNKPYTICTLKNTCKQLTISDYWGPEIYIMVVFLLIQMPILGFLIYMFDQARAEGNIIGGLKTYFQRRKRKVAPVEKETKMIEMTSTVSRMREEAAGMPDEDVLTEKARIEEIFDKTGPDDETVVLVKDLRKTFNPEIPGARKCCRNKRGRLRALNGFSLAVQEGEVFGLLGHNGAGKSTAMKVMICEEVPDSGRIKLCGTEVTNFQDVWSKVGYCSQTDPLWDNITFREHLEMFSYIRGVPEETVEELIEHFISGLQVTEHADQTVGGMSGGTKRKLTFAISMLGLPKIVLLDEPSTGLDPQSKRFLWNTIIGSFKEHRGAILTTHSIEEAEVLCARIGIMQKGSLICIGSPQHLKSKYGKGYLLEIKLKTQVEDLADHADPQERFAFVHENFPQAEISEIFADKGVFSIPINSIKSISSAFALLEKLKVQYNFEDYSFSQTTLEQIFLQFSKEVEEQELMEASRTTFKKDAPKPAPSKAASPAAASPPETAEAPK